MNETWTRAHDLALIFIALAYGTDNELDDSEVVSVTRAVQSWRPDTPEDEITEIVLEAVAIFLSGDAEEEVARSIQSLRKTLDVDQRRKALASAVDIAAADGIVLDAEKSLITVLSDIWEVEPAADAFQTDPSVSEEEGPAWSLLHDIALMYISVAATADAGLNAETLTRLMMQLQQWEPQISPVEIQSVLRDALHFYAEGASRDDLMESSTSIAECLVRSQRHNILVDLWTYIDPESDAATSQTEWTETLAKAWNVDIHLSSPDSVSTPDV